MWNWNFAFKILPQLLQATIITIEATVASFVIAMVLGLVFSLARRSKFKPLALFIGAFIEFIRSTPLLVQLYFIFYVLPLYGLTLPLFLSGALGLGLHYSTYLSEVFRSGIDAVPRGQWEASAALNFTKSQTWRRIVLPQAIPPVIPVLGNYLIVMFKETPLLSAITLVELLQTAKIIGSESFRYTEGFTLVGLIFLCLSYPSSLLIRHFENRLNQSMK